MADGPRQHHRRAGRPGQVGAADRRDARTARSNSATATGVDGSTSARSCAASSRDASAASSVARGEDALQRAGRHLPHRQRRSPRTRTCGWLARTCASPAPGSFNLPARSSTTPCVPSSPPKRQPTEGAVINLSNVEIPVHISGPWERAKPNLSVASRTDNRGDPPDRQEPQTPEVREAVKGLLGGDGQKRVKPRDLLEKLLKKQ